MKGDNTPISEASIWSDPAKVVRMVLCPVTLSILGWLLARQISHSASIGTAVLPAAPSVLSFLLTVLYFGRIRPRYVEAQVPDELEEDVGRMSAKLGIKPLTIIGLVPVPGTVPSGMARFMGFPYVQRKKLFLRVDQFWDLPRQEFLLKVAKALVKHKKGTDLVAGAISLAIQFAGCVACSLNPWWCPLVYGAMFGSLIFAGTRMLRQMPLELIAAVRLTGDADEAIKSLRSTNGKPPSEELLERIRAAAEGRD